MDLINTVYKNISEQLAEAVQSGYKKGLQEVVKLNKKKILRLAEPTKLFKISYTGADKELLANFEKEAFTVAAVLHFECEEKLKKIAKEILSGEHPYLQAHPESSIYDLWADEAYNILADYIEVADAPPPGQLTTNLRTAINSSFFAAEYNRLQELKDVYPYYQYKTQDDSLVRDEHKVLHDKVFAASDPAWNAIMPPNGWNCRCYFTPLTYEDAAEVPPENKIDLLDGDKRKTLIDKANIQKEFKRNAAKTESIWGKWLNEKLSNKNYEKITERMIEHVTQMPEPGKVIEQLEKNAGAFRQLDYTKENWEKEFPADKVETPLGEFKFGKYFEEKLIKENRFYLFGLIKPTLAEPEFVFVGKQNETQFFKAFNQKDKSKVYLGVLKNKDGEELIVSLHPRQERDIITKVKESKLLIHARRAGAHLPDWQYASAGCHLNFSKNKVKSGKLLVYQFGRVHMRDASPSDSSVVLPSATGRGSFNFVENNLAKDKSIYNEVWVEFLGPGKGNVYKIRYGIETFEVSIIGSGTQTSKVLDDTYDNIDKYRKGVLVV